MELLCYGKPGDKIRLDFLPCKNTNGVKQWENWHPKDSLRLYAADYIKLLPYFEKVFPATDPASGEIQDCFDECCDNWIGVDDWKKIILAIRKDVSHINNTAEALFFNKFTSWIESQTAWADIIVVEGNL